MMKYAIKPSKILVLLIIIFSFGCKSSKKMEAAKAKEKARIEQEEAAKLQKQMEDEIRKREASEKARREAEARVSETKPKEIGQKAKLTEYFNAIASAGNVNSANNSINEALTLFASPDTPLLIVISEYGGKKDYDRPTTIKDYLNYLKDQKKNINIISDLKVNAAGKITEVELKK